MDTLRSVLSALNQPFQQPYTPSTVAVITLIVVGTLFLWHRVQVHMRLE